MKLQPFILFFLLGCWVDAEPAPEIPDDDLKQALLARMAAKLGNSAQDAVIPNQYIVVLKPNEKELAAKEVKFNRLGATTLRKYNHAFDGFALEIDDPEVLAEIEDDNDVDYVTEDKVMTIDFVRQDPTPSWGLDRVDQSDLPLDNGYGYEYTGKEVEVFIMDTGIRTTHNDFGGRASCFVNLVQGESCEDQNGHGTHVSGIGTIYLIDDVLVAPRRCRR